jgi:quercetin 2,3-dioxygenase
MTTRTISVVETATTEMVGENRVKRALPTRNLKQVDPFLFVDFMAPTQVQAGAEIRIPPHPHAGFDVVTYILDGEFFHRDSRGNNQVAGPGDLNWMRAGSGIIHSEGPTDDFLKTGGKLQLMQVWINLPEKMKAVEPYFKHFDSSVLPETENSEVWIKTLIGEFGGKISPVSPATPMFYHHIKLNGGSRFHFPISENDTAALFVMQGNLRVLDQEVKAGQLVDFAQNGNQLVFASGQGAELILFGGKPIKEKVVHYGPFVMNSFKEIELAISDYETGRMGQLEY